MGEIKIHKNVFPFICKNLSCKREYDLESFTNVALLWGFIYLTKGEYCIIGITCPDCYYTTLRKFTSYITDFSMEILEKQGASKSYLGYSGEIEYDETPNFKYFVPFSSKILADLSLVSLPNFKEDQNRNKLYRIPFGFKPVAYSKYADDEYFIDEKDVSDLLEIENKEQYRAFPRIVPYRSIYAKSERWLTGLGKTDEISSDYMAVIHEALSVQLSSSYKKAHEPYKTAYDHMIHSDLSSDEYKDMDLSEYSWKRKSFQDNLREFIEEYKLLRNRIDFELICNNELINKFARKFYHDIVYIAHEKAEQMQMGALIEAIDNDDTWLEKGRIIDQIQELIARPDSEERSRETHEIKRPFQSEEEKKSEALLEIQSHKASLAELIEKETPSLKDYENVFKLIGSNWFVKFKGKHSTLSDNRKIRYVVSLLRKPGHRINNFKLALAVQERDKITKYKQIFNKSTSYNDTNDRIVKEAEEIELKDLFDVEENLTEGQKKKISQTVNELLEKLKEAVNTDDKEKIEEINQEIENIKRVLKIEYNAELSVTEKNEVVIKVRGLTLSKEANNVRVNIRNNLNNAYKEISKELPELKRHLIQCIETKSTYAVYDPIKSKTDKSIKWYIS